MPTVSYLPLLLLSLFNGCNKMSKLYESGGMIAVGVPKDIILLMNLHKGDEFVYSMVDDSTIRINIIRMNTEEDKP